MTGALLGTADTKMNDNNLPTFIELISKSVLCGQCYDDASTGGNKSI